MTPAQLLARLGNAEDNFVERKPKSVSAREIRRTASAFANTLLPDQTAVLFIGVSDRGRPIGVDNTDALQERVRKACDLDCYPPIKYTAHVIKDEDNSFVAVVIPASDQKPHFTGPAYERRGSSSVNATPEMYERLIASRNEKCGRIQQLGSSALTVIAHKKLGSSRYIPDKAYRERHECTVIEVNAHTVRLYDIGLSERFSEPLRNVDVSYDEQRHRPMLIIRQDG